MMSDQLTILVDFDDAAFDKHQVDDVLIHPKASETPDTDKFIL
jgi:hypothetical protein